MNIINGKEIAKEIRLAIKEKVSQIHGRKPGLAFVLIGDDPASHAYVRMKNKGCDEVGLHSLTLPLPETISEDDLLCEIQALNQDEKIDGILVQQPFPSHLSAPRIVAAIDPDKDVDGFHPINLGKLLAGQDDGFVACTPLGVAVLLEKCDVSAEGKEVVIVGRSNIVGKPLAAILVQKKKGCNATVTLAHSRTQNLKDVCQRADILIAAIGKTHFITADMVKKDAVVIDVGINRNEQNKFTGDVDFEHVKDKCSWITPVPGGVGPMTIAMLLSNTVLSFERKQ